MGRPRKAVKQDDAVAKAVHIIAKGWGCKATQMPVPFGAGNWVFYNGARIIAVAVVAKTEPGETYYLEPQRFHDLYHWSNLGLEAFVILFNSVAFQYVAVNKIPAVFVMRGDKAYASFPAHIFSDLKLS